MNTLFKHTVSKAVFDKVIVQWLQLFLAVTVIWILLQPYAGMRHDARLYTLQALNHLHPELYSNDIFLRYGSQDSFTWYTSIYAWVGAGLGMEHAAALLTALAQLLFLGACWRLARSITSARSATFIVGLVLILPGNYGSDFIFTYFETFITPRLLAEGLTILALIFFLSHRYWIAGALLCAAVVIHPIMAMAGLVFIAASFALKHPKISFLIALSGLLSVVLVLVSPIGSKLQFDEEWLQIVDARAPCLFLKNWMYADWARLAVPGVTLWLSALIAPTTKQKNIARAALLTGGCGLLVTLIGNDVFKLIIVTQGQAWRWLWLSTLLALLLLVPLMQQLWARNKAGRATVLLLTAAWLVRNESSSLGLIVFAGTTGFASLKHLADEATWRKMFVGSTSLLSLTIIWMIAMNLLMAGRLLYTYHWPNWIDLLKGICEDGLIPLLYLCGVFLICLSKLRWLKFLSTTVTMLFVATLGYYSWENWCYQEYSPAVVKEMQGWRNLIPEGQDVLWLEGITPTWLALERPNYISGVQATVTLFSRSAAMVLKQREQEISPIFPNSRPLQWTGPSSLQNPSTNDLSAICAQIPVQFVVTQQTLNAKPLAAASANMPVDYRNAKLYGCK